VTLLALFSFHDVDRTGVRGLTFDPSLSTPMPSPNAFTPRAQHRALSRNSAAENARCVPMQVSKSHTLRVHPASIDRMA